MTLCCQGDPAGGNAARQNTAGIVILMPANRRVVLDNLTIRNWVVGVHVGASSRLSIINCRITNNLNHGVFAFGNSLVTIDESQVVGNGFRIGGPSSTPNPGAGVFFFDNASGAVFRTQISENFSTGFADQSTGTTTTQDVYLFGNNPDF